MHVKIEKMIKLHFLLIMKQPLLYQLKIFALLELVAFPEITEDGIVYAISFPLWAPLFNRTGSFPSEIHFSFFFFFSRWKLDAYKRKWNPRIRHQL